MRTHAWRCAIGKMMLRLCPLESRRSGWMEAGGTDASRERKRAARRAAVGTLQGRNDLLQPFTHIIRIPLLWKGDSATDYGGKA